MASETYEILELGPEGLNRYCIMEAATKDEADEMAALLKQMRGPKTITFALPLPNFKKGK